MVVADFILDPATQAHQQDLSVLGAFSVLDPARLTGDAALPTPSHPALPSLEALGPTLAEPHPSWMERLVAEWSTRYTK